MSGPAMKKRKFSNSPTGTLTPSARCLVAIDEGLREVKPGIVVLRIIGFILLLCCVFVTRLQILSGSPEAIYLILSILNIMFCA